MQRQGQETETRSVASGRFGKTAAAGEEDEDEDEDASEDEVRSGFAVVEALAVSGRALGSAWVSEEEGGAYARKGAWRTLEPAADRSVARDRDRKYGSDGNGASGKIEAEARTS